jgi:hypothetical protein
MTLPITPRTVVVASKKQLTCDLSGEAAILHVDSGQYYGLDPVGARIWALVQQPCSVRALCDAILEEYEVEPERCERDVCQLLESLSGAGLIEIRDTSTVSPGDRGG